MLERGAENHVVEQKQASLLLQQSALREHLEWEGGTEGWSEGRRKGRERRMRKMGGDEGGIYC